MNRQLKYSLWRLMGSVFASKSSENKAGQPNLESLKSVLILRPDRLGDVILSTPVYETIKRSVPSAKVTVLAQKGPAKALENNPFVDRVTIFNPRTPWKTFWNLKTESYDLAIVLNQKFSATAATLALLSKAKWRAGYAHPENVGSFNIRVPLPASAKSEVEYNLDILRHMNFSFIVDSPAVYTDEKMEHQINYLLKKLRSHPKQPLILMKPGVRLKKWGWRIEKFKTLCKKICSQGLGEIVLIKGPGEEDLIANFLENMENPPVVLPQLNVRELACVMKKSNLLICNHTGIMHLASAVKIPVAAIFKHGDTIRWGPYRVPRVILEERNNDSLSPEKVLKQVRNLLNSKASDFTE